MKSLRMRVLVVGALAFVLLSIPELIEFATGRATLDAIGIFVELTETLGLTATIAAIGWLMIQAYEMRRERAALTRELVQSQAENIRWRDSAQAQMQGVRLAIDVQFDAWQFTPAEKEIASLLLKGCSHKQIADIRQSSASTVRQQAQSLYRKSGLENRSELAAYFLDAILHSSADEDIQAPEAPAQLRKMP